jgi:hypothetical protein
MLYKVTKNKEEAAADSKNVHAKMRPPAEVYSIVAVMMMPHSLSLFVL